MCQSPVDGKLFDTPFCFSQADYTLESEHFAVKYAGFLKGTVAQTDQSWLLCALSSSLVALSNFQELCDTNNQGQIHVLLLI